jgi:uncharacterized protein
MKKLKYIPLLLIWVFAFISANLSAQNDRYKDIPDAPSPARMVNNLSKEFPDFLSADETARLEKKLQDFSNSTSNQIVIVIVDDLAGYASWEYATNIGEKWGVGTDKYDNGVVILIKPTGGAGQRDIAIAVGEGLQPKINATRNVHVKDDIIVPLFKNGEFYEALDQGTDALMAMAKDAYDDKAATKKSKGIPWGTLIAILIMMIIFIRFMKGGGGGGFTMGGPRFHRGGWGSGGSWGGGGSWGAGGGGFGGFGGGSFGGGGVSGKW